MRRRKTPIRKAIDILITLFLLAALIYLGRDMLRSGRLTFLYFEPTSITWGKCRLSPPPKNAIKAWKIMVRNSKTLSSLPALASLEGTTTLSIRVTGKGKDVVVTFYPQDKKVVFLAQGKKIERAFQIDPWTFGKWETALKTCCKEEP